jgi:CRP/FNR family cyclic AMP-dependent transcriptional regulator
MFFCGINEEFNHAACSVPRMTRPETPTEAARALARLPLFEGVDERTMEETAAVTTWRGLKKRQQVLSKGAAGDHLLFLASGRLQVLDVTESGREIGLNLLMPGDYFGELSIIDGQPRSASVVAIENSVVALVPKAQAWQLFRHNPLVAERILNGLAARLRGASVYQTILCLPNASQRVYALVLRLCKVAPGGLVVVDYPPKQQALAIMANTSRESVSRALKVLTDRRIVEKDRHRLIVRDRKALEKLAAQEGH